MQCVMMRHKGAWIAVAAACVGGTGLFAASINRVERVYVKKNSNRAAPPPPRAVDAAPDTSAAIAAFDAAIVRALFDEAVAGDEYKGKVIQRDADSKAATLAVILLRARIDRTLWRYPDNAEPTILKLYINKTVQACSDLKT